MHVVRWCNILFSPVQHELWCFNGLLTEDIIDCQYIFSPWVTNTLHMAFWIIPYAWSSFIVIVSVVLPVGDICVHRGSVSPIVCNNILIFPDFSVK